MVYELYRNFSLVWFEFKTVKTFIAQEPSSFSTSYCDVFKISLARFIFIHMQPICFSQILRLYLYMNGL
jgi:hypothetical protein